VSPRFPHRRSFLGLVVRPERQLRYALLFVGGAMLSVTALVALTGIVFNHTLKNLADNGQIQTDIGLLLKDTMIIPFFILVLGAFAIGTISILLGIKYSNRVYGPLIPLQRHIQNLKEGHYGSRAILRRNDELTELRDSLNELAAILEARHPK
jgi:methyl-accepting chemotaxis protein